LQELSVFKAAGEKLGMSIKGGSKGMGYNPTEKTDEGIFISKVCYTHVLITGESLNPT
jgi:protein scribble